MKSLSLTQRLSLTFGLMLLICSVLSILIQYQSRTQYSDAVVQNLSRSLAFNIAERHSLLDEGVIISSASSLISNKLREYNPSVEVYLLDKNGSILNKHDGGEKFQRENVELEPIKKFLSNEPFPIYGSNPQKKGKLKVFSATPLIYNSKVIGYLYIVLLGENYVQLKKNASNEALLSSMFWTVCIIVICGLIIGCVTYYWVTYPVRCLTKLVNQSLQNEQENSRLTVIPLPENTDEVAQLCRAFSIMSRRINCQLDSLALKDQQRCDLIANISHDLRTPLMSIQGYLETVVFKSSCLTEEQKTRYINIAYTQTIRVEQLSQELFELARLDYGENSLRVESFNLFDVINDIKLKFELRFKEKNISFSVDCPSEIKHIDADKSMIERVLINLIDNSIRYAPILSVISLKIWGDEESVMFEVSDQGPGVPDVVKKKLFKQIPNSTDFRGNNGGLGLLLVHRMLQLHKGDIWLEESPGACFRFYIPKKFCHTQTL